MPRAGWVKPQTDQRLSDHISIGVLTRVFPPELVDRVVGEAGRTEQRQRLLPARVVVYYVLGLGLYSSASYEEVMRMLVDGLSWQSGWQRPWSVPTKAALFKARTRLGPEPLRALFEQVALPLAEPQTAGAFDRDWRLVSIDGTCLDVADTTANEQAFGRPGSGHGEGVGAFPQLRLVGLGECGTHALFDVAIGSLSDDERTLTGGVLGSLGPGMLCLADRGFYSFELWNRAQESGAQLVWRTKSNHRLKVHQRGPRVVLRSKTPDGVTQEVYGHLRVHYAIRWLMHTVALEQGHDPDRISFTRTLRVARGTTASHGGFSPRSTREDVPTVVELRAAHH